MQRQDDLARRASGGARARRDARSLVDAAHDRVEAGHDGHVSATRWPGVSSPTACRLKYDGSWMRNRNGWSEPSLMA